MIKNVVEDGLAEFLASWVAASAEPQHGVSDDDVSELENRYAAKFPAAFRAYLQRANGMAPGDMDSERLIHFYAMDEMARTGRNEPSTDERARYLVFADFMIGSHEYAIALAGPEYGKVAIVDDTGPPRVVADSFVDFMDKYVHSPRDLWRAK